MLPIVRAMAKEDASANPSPMPQRVPEPTIRVKVPEGFSTEWAGIPFDASAGSIVDLPKGFVRTAGHLFEVVDATTPLCRVQPSEVPR